MNQPMTPNPQPPQIINIDGADYFIQDLTPEVRGTMTLMDLAKGKIQNFQTELALAQAAYNELGSQLRVHLVKVKPIAPPKVETPRRAPAKKTPAQRPANSNKKPTRKRR